MYGDIDALGNLIIKRGIHKVIQYCPYGDKKYCNHTCPLFLEEDGRVFPCGNKNVIIEIIIDERYINKVENE